MIDDPASSPPEDHMLATATRIRHTDAGSDRLTRYRLYVGGVLVGERDRFLAVVELADGYLPCIRAGVRVTLLADISDHATISATANLYDHLDLGACE